MSEEAKLAGLKLLVDNLQVFSAHCLKVKDKTGQIVPFLWNKAQHHIHKALEEQLAETGKVRALLLKGRQQGGSTYIGARFYHRATTRFGKSAFIVAHEQKATDNLYAMVKRYHEHNPLPVSTGATNAKELIFDKLDGGYKLATAGTKDVGRSNTAQLLHGCLSPDTLVVDGVTGALRRMADFSVGDMVRTHTGAVAPVSVISLQQKPARDVRVRTFGLPFTATDEHRFWTPSGWRELGELKAGDEIGFPIAQIEERRTFVPFAMPAVSRPQGGGSVECVPPEVELNYDVGRILGLYLAEGTVQTQAKSGAPSCVMFSVHEREVDRTIHWLGILSGLFSSIKIYRHKGSKTAVVNVYGKSFAGFVDRMCGRTDGKRVPAEWLTSGAEFARGLAHGYLCGDGHFSPAKDRRIRATSVRSAITIGMRDILASTGYGWASIEHKPAAIRNGRNEREAFILGLCGRGVVQLSKEVGKPFVPYERHGNGGRHGYRIDGGYAWLKIESIGEPAMQDVMDFEVDHHDHSYCLPNGASHNSEFAFWANAQTHLAGIGNTIGDLPGSEIILESTANGVGNAFHTMWLAAERGEGEYQAIFVPWFWQEEYRAPLKTGFKMSADDEAYMRAYGLDLEQMQWRANKIATYGEGFEWLFDQEYPATPALAFKSSTQNPLINPTTVMAAVNSGYRHLSGPLIIGCDPAGDGANDPDRTAIAFRRGRVCFRIEYHERLTTMQVAGKLAEYWRDMEPDAIFIDKGGLGAGVVDRLHELNIPVIGINNAERARDPEIYENRRAEMWWLMKEWFEDQPARIPNDMALISDITSPQPKVSSNGRKLLEKKDDMAKRQLRSPDGGDALALTFAEPVAYRSTVSGMTGSGGYTPATSAGY